jgi:hydrogenase/urease accessory protein HupE
MAHEASSLAGGFAHPLLGRDHVVAIAAVGLLRALLRSGAIL